MTAFRIQVADRSRLVRVRVTAAQLAGMRKRFNNPALAYPSAGDLVSLRHDGADHSYFVVSVTPTDDGVELTATLNVERPTDPKPTSFRRRRLIELRQTARRQA